jgi:hypothetical protein
MSQHRIILVSTTHSYLSGLDRSAGRHSIDHNLSHFGELLDTVLADSLVLISTDVEVSIKINGSTDSQTLKPITGVKTPVFLYRGSISSILVSNSSGSDATLDVTRIKV